MKIPKFKSEKEEAEFWDTHSFVDYLDDMVDVKPFQLSPALREKIAKRRRSKMQLVLSLDRDLVEQTKRIASKKAVKYQTLMSRWIREGLNHEKAG